MVREIIQMPPKYLFVQMVVEVMVVEIGCGNLVCKGFLIKQGWKYSCVTILQEQVSALETMRGYCRLTSLHQRVAELKKDFRGALFFIFGIDERGCVIDRILDRIDAVGLGQRF